MLSILCLLQLSTSLQQAELVDVLHSNRAEDEFLRAEITVFRIALVCLPTGNETMSSAELAVARASLSAALFKPDPTPCLRDDIEQFLSLLAAAITQCSPANVQV
jgi:hypothetical protein